MNVVAIFDSFKGSISSMQAGEASVEGARRVYPELKAKILPLADGGEGTVDALVAGLGGRIIVARVKDPLGVDIDAKYGIINDDVAIIEMSAAAGITLIKPEERNPLRTTTYGVGQLIRDAITKGCRKFIVGIGGSATNDGGIGMLSALGFGLYNAEGKQVAFGAEGLKELEYITVESAMPELKSCEFKIACDVTNPLCGVNGCSRIYGPQKGATPEMIADMDAWLDKYADLTKQVFPKADPEFAGTGAAGGIGFAFLAYMNASLQSGVSIVLDAVEAEKYIKEADIVLTGEGRLDGQSAMGKAPVGVARLAKKHNKPVIAFSGCVGDNATKCNDEGIDAFFPILQAACTLEEAMDINNARSNLSKTAEQAFRLVKYFNR